MKMDKKLMMEIDKLWTDHEAALTHFGLLCVAAAKAGHNCKIRRYLRRGMIMVTMTTIIITYGLDLVSETY